MLRPTRKITKREIKEDPLVTAYVKVQRFLRENSKILNVGFTILVIVLAVAILMGRSKKRAEVNAAGQLGMAEQFYYAEDYPKAIPELEQIINTFSGTRSAGKAVFFVANAYYKDGDYMNAQKYYRLYIDDYADTPLFTASSYAGVAACKEGENLYSEAASFYETAAIRFPDVFNAPYHLKNAARCFRLAGELEKAKEMYQTILDRYPQSPVQQEIASLIEAL